MMVGAGWSKKYVVLFFFLNVALGWAMVGLCGVLSNMCMGCYLGFQIRSVELCKMVFLNILCYESYCLCVSDGIPVGFGV